MKTKQFNNTPSKTLAKGIEICLYPLDDVCEATFYMIRSQMDLQCAFADKLTEVKHGDIEIQFMDSEYNIDKRGAYHIDTLIRLCDKYEVQPAVVNHLLNTFPHMDDVVTILEERHYMVIEAIDIIDALIDYMTMTGANIPPKLYEYLNYAKIQREFEIVNYPIVEIETNQFIFVHQF